MVTGFQMGPPWAAVRWNVRHHWRSSIAWRDSRTFPDQPLSSPMQLWSSLRKNRACGTAGSRNCARPTNFATLRLQTRRQAPAAAQRNAWAAACVFWSFFSSTSNVPLVESTMRPKC